MQACRADIEQLRLGLNDLILSQSGCSIVADASATVDDPINNVYASLTSAYNAAKTLANQNGSIVTVCIRPGTYPDNLIINSNNVQFTASGTAGAMGSIPDIFNAIFFNTEVIPLGEILITGTWTLSNSPKPYLFASNLTFNPVSNPAINTSALTAGGEIRLYQCLMISETPSAGPILDMINGGNAESGIDPLLLVLFDCLVVNRGYLVPGSPATPGDNQAIRMGTGAVMFVEESIISGGQRGAPAGGRSAACIVLDGDTSASSTLYNSQISGSIFIDKPSVVGLFGPNSGLIISDCRLTTVLFSNQFGMIEYGTSANTVSTGFSSPYVVTNTTFAGYPWNVTTYCFYSPVGTVVNTLTSGNAITLPTAPVVNNIAGVSTNTSVPTF